MNIKTKLASNEEEQLFYIKSFIKAKDNISAVVSSCNIDNVIEELEEHQDNIQSFICVKTDYDDIYYLTKITNPKNKRVSIISKPFNDNVIESDIVLIEEYMLDEENEIKEYIIADEVMIVGLEADHQEVEEDKKECRDCCEGCNCSCYNNIEADNEDDIDKEIEEYILEKVRQYRNDDIDTLEELCFQIYGVAYDDGFNSALLSMKNSIDKSLNEC